MQLLILDGNKLGNKKNQNLEIPNNLKWVFITHTNMLILLYSFEFQKKKKIIKLTKESTKLMVFRFLTIFQLHSTLVRFFFFFNFVQIKKEKGTDHQTINQHFFKV